MNVGEDVLTFRDLVLDWWVLADGTVHEEDAEELEQLRQSGIVTGRDAARAQKARLEVLSRYRHIIDNVEAEERRLGLWGE